MSFYETAFDRFVKPAVDGLVPQTAEAWQLYAGDPNATGAAAEMTRCLSKMLAQLGRIFLEGMCDLERCMEDHAVVGAVDTEPRAELHHAVRSMLEYLSREML